MNVVCAVLNDHPPRDKGSAKGGSTNNFGGASDVSGTTGAAPRISFADGCANAFELAAIKKIEMMMKYVMLRTGFLLVLFLPLKKPAFTISCII
jgi:hypothetical protein